MPRPAALHVTTNRSQGRPVGVRRLLANEAGGMVGLENHLVTYNGIVGLCNDHSVANQEGSGSWT